MARLLFDRGARGQAIEDIQTGLGFAERDVDGSYGGQTRQGVAGFQATSALPQTGQVDDVTWERLLHKAIPPIFERCLALTAAFEGHGFSLAQGNFDGAGITWGIIGFTLKHGELAKIVLAIENTRPDLVRLAFDDHTNQLLDVLASPLQKQLAFANSVSIGPSKVRLAEPWRRGFDLFGKLREVRLEQLARAREDYFDAAEETAQAFNLMSELGIALAFDVHVQNGGIKRTAASQIRRAGTPANEAELRLIVADAVADNARAEFRKDVRARKRAIAEQSGLVHGELFTLSHWGLSERRGIG